MRRFAKIVVSIGLIAALAWNVEWTEIYTYIRESQPAPALIAVLLLTVQYPLSAWKWRISLKLHGVSYPFGYLLRVLCIAFFFNNFLPSSIGGDVYRAYRTFGRSDSRAYSISAVIVERAVGLIMLAVVGYLSAIILAKSGAIPFKRVLYVASAAIGAFVFIALIAWQSGLLTKITDRLSRIDKLEPLLRSARIVRTNRRYFWALVGLSMIFQVVAICAIAFLFAALGVPGKYLESAFTATAAGLSAVIPLSINGIGIVEGSFAIAATLANLPYTQAVVVAFFLRIFNLAVSIVFGILYLFERGTDNALNLGDAS